ncbi:BAG family molecular chaperone regulator 1 isoform X2 [Latimeria chalumnae]|nr:PREDICTED: BAG family molecular chaperone regulator 1 isoform X2 [Latimeria chalumnae]XP_014352026.1 PREDICTED: BAG family molecular chaperone regulator 1 isoform X2 [Latimeria chalumnae]|eukprot:XP_006009223.1 PREDICTED: BAG family molecular chaperone regulator 1 isoform X2 [Latimeria chalumnae]
MAQVIAEVTGVPLPNQKLIYKGKSLKEMEQPLSALGIKDGCKVMLIGKKSCPEEEDELKKIKDFEKSVEQISKKLVEFGDELAGIQKGFLANNLRIEALGRLDKKVKGLVEQFMKILEQVDALSLPENFNECRSKRKSLVKNVQNYLSQCDTIQANIDQETEKLQSKNLVLKD